MIDINKTRKEFEEWFDTDLVPVEADWFEKDADGYYVLSFVNHAWGGYQAGYESGYQAGREYQELTRNKILEEAAQAVMDSATSYDTRTHSAVEAIRNLKVINPPRNRRKSNE